MQNQSLKFRFQSFLKFNIRIPRIKSYRFYFLSIFSSTTVVVKGLNLKNPVVTDFKSVICLVKRDRTKAED